MNAASHDSNPEYSPAVLAVTTVDDPEPEGAATTTAADCDADDGAVEAAAAEAASLLENRSRGPPPFPTNDADSLELEALTTSPKPPAPSLSMAKTDKCPAGTDSSTGPCSGRISLLMGRIRFCVRESPGMSRSEQVRYLRPFRLGDTYKLKTRSWLLPQFLSGALILTGVVLTLVGIISLQINKYLHACDAEDGVDCKTNKAYINNIMMPIGVGSTGGGLTLILISGFIFLHAFCVIYEDSDSEDDGAHDGVLHIPPISARAALIGSTTALSPEALAASQSYYDNLQDYTGD